MGCSTSLAKMFLFVFNVAFFIFGVASLSVGIWVIASKNELFRFINLVDNHVSDGANKGDIDSIANQNGMVTSAGYVLIGLGLFTLLVGFCGCCGAMKESKCLLMIYATLVGLVLIVELVAAIMAAVFQNRVRSETEAGMLHLQEKFFVAMPEFMKNSNSTTSAKIAVTLMLNYVQMMFECCGAHTVNDIGNSTSWKASDRAWQDGRQLKVPLTCCRLNPNAKSTVMNPTYNWTQITGDLVDPNCPFNGTVGSAGMHDKTCYSSILEYVGRFSGPLIGICVGIALLELLGILFACCLIKAVENDVSYAKQ